MPGYCIPPGARKGEGRQMKRKEEWTLEHTHLSLQRESAIGVPQHNLLIVPFSLRTYCIVISLPILNRNQVGQLKAEGKNASSSIWTNRTPGFWFLVQDPETKTSKTLIWCSTTFPTPPKVKYFQACKCIASTR